MSPQIDGRILETLNATIEIKNGIVEAITSDPSASRDLADDSDTTVIDARGMLITPALTDCHTHLTFAGNRAAEFARRLAGESYESISRSGGGIQNTVRATRAATEIELQEITASRLTSWLHQGVATVEIKSGYGLNTENEEKILRAIHGASLNSPVEVVPTFLGAHALPLEASGDAAQYIVDVCKMIANFAPKGLMAAVDAYCESIAFSPDQVEKVFRCAQDHGLAIKLHAEQLSDSGGAIRAAQLGALSCDHLEYLSPEGVDAMAQAGSVAVLLPGAFFHLRESKKPPTGRLREAGVPIAIATDFNPGTSPVRSLRMCGQWAALLFGLSLEEVFLGITLNATRALGRPLSESTVQIGQTAKLAIWNCQSLPELFYESGDNPCQGCIIGDTWHPTPHSQVKIIHRLEQTTGHIQLETR